MISLQKYKSIKLESCHQGVLTDLDELMNLLPNLISPFAQYDKDLCFGCEVPTRQLIKKKKKSICQSNIAMMTAYKPSILFYVTRIYYASLTWEWLTPTCDISQ